MTIQVIEFKTIYKPQPDGKEPKAIDIVRYTTSGARKFAVQEDTLTKLGKVLPLVGNETNQAVVMANHIWDTIKPRYEAWKAGQEIPVEGTPLGAWPAINQAIAEALKANGIRTVEEFAEVSESVVARLNVPKAKDFRMQAIAYLENRDTVKVASQMQQKDEEVADLKSEIEEMKAMIAGLTKDKAASEASEVPEAPKAPKTPKTPKAPKTPKDES